MVGNAWFRLIVRLVGVLLLGLAVPEVVQWVIYLGGMMFASDARTPSFGMDSWYWLWSYLGGALATAIQAAFGIYLLFFGERLIRRCLQDTIGRCPLCQYDLKGRAGDRCPECGWALPGVAGTPATPPATTPMPASTPGVPTP